MADQTSIKALALFLRALAEQAKADPSMADDVLRDPAGVVSRLLGAPPPDDVLISASRDADGGVALSLTQNACEGELDDRALQHIAAGSD
jgi:hypothetical protein